MFPSESEYIVTSYLISLLEKALTYTDIQTGRQTDIQFKFLADMSKCFAQARKINITLRDRSIFKVKIIKKSAPEKKT
jgi:hypothetical protein